MPGSVLSTTYQTGRREKSWDTPAPRLRGVVFLASLSVPPCKPGADADGLGGPQFNNHDTAAQGSGHQRDDTGTGGALQAAASVLQLTWCLRHAEGHAPGGEAPPVRPKENLALRPAPGCKASTSLSVHVQCHGHPSRQRLALDGVSGAASALHSKNSAWKELDVNIRGRKGDTGKDTVETARAVAGRASERTSALGV